MDIRSKRDIYDQLMEAYKLPVFYQPWYLDCVCQEGLWDVAMAMKADEVLGIWPYYLKSKLGTSYMTMPPLTPYLGPWVFSRQQNIKPATQIGYEKKVLHQLVAELPTALWHICHTHPSFKNWQPLSWKKYQQTTRYTYQLNLVESIDFLNNNLTDKTRNQIRSCQKRVEVKKSCEEDALYELIKKTYSRQNQEPPFSASFFEDLYVAATKNDALKSYTAYDQSAPVAFVSTIEDHDTTYLTLTGREDSAPPGTVSLLIWEAILEAKSRGKKIFDFEGSMIEAIESFFRSFGGAQIAYHRLLHTSGKGTRMLLQVLNRL